MVNVVVWEGITTVYETLMFNSWELFDSQDKNLKEYLEQVVRGKINGETGTYKIGVNPRNKEIFHRFFNKD